MKMESMRDLFVHELGDLYDAETQIIKSLPKMAEAATSSDLRLAFERHLEETQGHIRRLEQIFARLGEKIPNMTCKGMKGLLQEGSEVIKDRGDPAVKDAALIAAAQRVEHYEMAGYGCARTFAEILGDQSAADALQVSLDEERQTDEMLTELARGVINVEAAQA